MNLSIINYVLNIEESGLIELSKDQKRRLVNLLEAREDTDDLDNLTIAFLAQEGIDPTLYF